jgi:hypothetical protein
MFLQNLPHDAKNRKFRRAQGLNPFVRLMFGDRVVLSTSANEARRKLIASYVQSSYLHRHIEVLTLNV